MEEAGKSKAVEPWVFFIGPGVESVPSALADGIIGYVGGPVDYLSPPAYAGGTDFVAGSVNLGLPIGVE